MISKIYIKKPIENIGINFKENKIILETNGNKFVLEINYNESFERLINTIKMSDV